MEFLKLFGLPFAVSLLLVPIVKKMAWKLNIYALENARTVHHGKIARVGGIAVYVAFILALTLFTKIDDSMRGVLLGGFVVFIGGLLDDMYDLPAWAKLLFQSAGAICVMWIGDVYLLTIHLPFGWTIHMQMLSLIITFVWIIGITNALNLLDGLDGLSSGFSIIVLFTICLLSTRNHRPDVLIVSLALAGATGGFLVYNFHPASIFIGDCGAQFLGFMIASISLMGFKGGTFITLVIPIILLFVPIMDTLIAIVRRKLNGQKFSDPDKRHLHHTLMRVWNLGQRETVLIIYAITAMFGITAYLYVVNEKVGFVILLVLIASCEIFIEATGMVSKKYRPILTVLDMLKRAVSTEHEQKKEEKAHEDSL